jgi:tRNA A37 methylthiotransferase MiaB
MMHSYSYIFREGAGAARSQSQIDHQKLSSFVNRLDLDIKKEAEALKQRVGKAQSLVPTVQPSTEKAKLKFKKADGTEEEHYFQILTGKAILSS